jgi:predicted Na+-dependent transporter
MKFARFRPDTFTLMLLAAVLIASVLPVQGQAAVGFAWLTHAAIALLFFLHGAKLSRQAIVAGALHWRLHVLVFAVTFGAFPLFGVLFKPLLSPLVTGDLYLGVLYLCALPATVQSAIALLRWRGATFRRRFAAPPPPPCWAFSSLRCWWNRCWARPAAAVPYWIRSSTSCCN